MENDNSAHSLHAALHTVRKLESKIRKIEDKIDKLVERSEPEILGNIDDEDEHEWIAVRVSIFDEIIRILQPDHESLKPKDQWQWRERIPTRIT